MEWGEVFIKIVNMTFLSQSFQSQLWRMSVFIKSWDLFPPTVSRLILFSLSKDFLLSCDPDLEVQMDIDMYCQSRAARGRLNLIRSVR